MTDDSKKEKKNKSDENQHLMKSKYKLVLSMRHTDALFSPNAINGTQFLPSACRMESTERKERKTVCVDLRVELF